MAEDHDSKGGRRPPRDHDEEFEGSSTEDEFPAADDSEDGPIAREMARRGLETEAEESEDDGYVEDLSGGGGFVFDSGDGSTGDVEAGETFVGELPLDDEEPPVDKTEILSVPAAGPEEYAVLTIETADGNVSDVEVIKDRFVLGRAPDADMVIPDSLVSRHHAVVEERDDGWYLVDQESGNGTLLNEERISDELLYDGDVFQIGDAFITFQAPGGDGGDGAPRLDKTQMLNAADLGVSEGTNVGSVPSPQKKKKKLVLVVFACVALLMGIGGIAFQMLKPKGPSPEEVAAEKARVAAAEAEQARSEAMKKFKKVDELCKQDKWREALPLIQEVAQVLTDEKEVTEYKKTIEKEATASEALEKAREFVIKKNFEGAMAALGTIPKNSSQGKGAEELKKKIEEEHLTHLLEQARVAMGDKNYEGAIEVAEQILVASPDNPVAKEIREKAEKEKSKIATHTPVRKKRKKKKITKPKPPPKPKHLLVGKALDLYRSEKVDQALSQASSAGVSAEGVKILRRFQSFYKRGMEMSRNPGQSGQAIKFLTKALGLDKKLGGSKGNITATLRKKLAKVYFLQGVDAHTRKKYPLAYKSLTSALKFNPGLDQAKKRLKNLEIEAKKLFETAYVIKGSSPEKAVSHCQTVMGMVQKKNIYYGKCKKLVGKIRGPMGNEGGGDGF